MSASKVLSTLVFLLVSVLTVKAETPTSVMKYYQIPATSTHPARGIPVELITLVTPKPTVGVILFAGSNGAINYSNGQPGATLAGNFLVRSRMSFAKKGLLVAVVDLGPNGVTETERLTQGHADIIAALIEKVRKDPIYGVASVWLVGTSSGTLSVSNIAARYPLQPVANGPKSPPSTVNDGRPNGIVLTSTQTLHYDNRDMLTVCTKSIDDVVPAVSNINVPADVIWNLTDRCGCSPGATKSDGSSIARSVVTKLGINPKGPRRTGKAFNGPAAPGVADQCKANTPHGFLNIEEEVVSYIADSVLPH